MPQHATRFRRFAIAVTAALALGLCPAAALAYVNWPAYLFGPDHSSFNPAATAITARNASRLTAAWPSAFVPPAHAGRARPFLYGSPTVYNGRIYIAAYDGYLYEIDEQTGAVINSVDLGAVTACAEQPNAEGTAGTATVLPDPARGPSAATVYITGASAAGGDGGTYLWALDADDLHPVWSTDPVAVDTQTGSFSWTSPTVAGGKIYVGISSQCDDPLVRGGVGVVNQATGTLTGTYFAVPAGTVGASVWSSVGATSAAAWTTTGNADETTAGAPPGDSYSIVRLNGATRGSVWTVPGAYDAKQDYDFGGSPTLFDGLVGGNSTPLVGACDKNGFYYVVRRADPSAGPVWAMQIGKPSTYPPFDACLSAAIWDSASRQLIIGGNATLTLDGKSYYGSLQALDPSDAPANRVLWDNGLPCNVIGTPTENGKGLVAVVTWTTCESGGHPSLYVFNARSTKANANGRPDARLLKEVALGSGGFGQPVFADDMMFVASSSTGLMAYKPINVRVSGSQLMYTATDGENNNTTISESSGVLTITDTTGTLLPGVGCSAVDTHTATCSAAGVTSITADAGDGDDTLTVTAPVPSVLRGGPGADHLNGGPVADTLDGGTGADVVSGGAGVDTASYAVRTETQPVVAAIDGLPDSGDRSSRALDGPNGAQDTIQPDVENLTGGKGDDTLSGSPSNNVLTGGAGADTLRGLGGNDTLKARDGVVDTELDCDGGDPAGAADKADIDLSDPAPTGCETVTHP